MVFYLFHAPSPLNTYYERHRLFERQEAIKSEMGDNFVASNRKYLWLKMEMAKFYIDDATRQRENCRLEFRTCSNYHSTRPKEYTIGCFAIDMNTKTASDMYDRLNK